MADAPASTPVAPAPAAAAEQGPASPAAATDHLANLRKMSTTAGLGTGDYAAVSPVAVAALIVAVIGGLAFLYDFLLVIPAAGVVLGLLGLRQIANSNGTLTGRPLAMAALGISGLIIAVVGGMRIVDYVGTRDDRDAIRKSLAGFGDDLAAHRYDAAYKRMSPAFQDRITGTQFADKFKSLDASAPEAGGLASAKWNEAVQFPDVPANAPRVAEVGVLLSFRRAPEPVFTVARMVHVEGQWLIHDLPQLFPESRQPRPRGVQPGQPPPGQPAQPTPGQPAQPAPPAAPPR